MHFIPGLELNEGFFHDVVSPILKRERPTLRYSCGLLGYGSDVLGFDTAVSMDHNWGPRLQIFIAQQDFPATAEDLNALLRDRLPTEYRDFPTNFTLPGYDGTQSMEPAAAPPVNHLIEIATVPEYFSRYLGIDAAKEPTPSEWTSLADQKLLEVTSGRVFHDGLDELNAARARFAVLPRAALLERLMRLWKSVEEDEPLVGRTAALRTLDGTKILAARLVETCMKICMYLEGRYIPYRKWLYRAFEMTHAYAGVHPLCMDVLFDNDPITIERGLVALYEKVVDIHNRRGDLPHLANRARNFHGRPYRVIFAETIVAALRDAIDHPETQGRAAEGATGEPTV
jgi:Domain of unknown function (DUF4037)